MAKTRTMGKNKQCKNTRTRRRPQWPLTDPNEMTRQPEVLPYGIQVIPYGILIP